MEGDGAGPHSSIWIPACLRACEMLARWRGSIQPINFLVDHAGHLVIRALACPSHWPALGLGYTSLALVRAGAGSRSPQGQPQECRAQVQEKKAPGGRSGCPQALQHPDVLGCPQPPAT